jgi:hypothetical protein
MNLVDITVAQNPALAQLPALKNARYKGFFDYIMTHKLIPKLWKVYLIREPRWTRANRSMYIKILRSRGANELYTLTIAPPQPYLHYQMVVAHVMDNVHMQIQNNPYNQVGPVPELPLVINDHCPRWLDDGDGEGEDL